MGRPRATSRPFLPGDVIAGRFRILREVGEGGMGIVYEVQDEKLHERRALKCAKPGYSEYVSPEARSALRVTHPNVCRVFEVHSAACRTGTIDFLSMEYLDGQTLSSALTARDGWSKGEVLAIALQVCAGIGAAHAQGLLHRDLKPTNVLLARDAAGRTRAVVTDFGLAQAPVAADAGPASSVVAGTRDYLSPERARGEPASIASDIFALGVVLHELASGRLPGFGVRGDRILAPEISPRWRTIIARCLEHEPTGRYRSVSQVADALSRSTPSGRTAAWTAAIAALVATALWQLIVPATVGARLAVLPFEGVDEDAQTAALVTGTSYELSATLSRLRPRPAELIVIPLEETQAITDINEQLARQRLGASHVLRTRMRRRGDRMVVEAAIVDTVTSVAQRRWSAEYALSDAGAAVPGLTALVAATFRLPRQERVERLAPQAFRAYAEATAALRGGSSSLRRAVSGFERAIDLDPASVLPRAGLVEACHSMWRETRDAAWLVRGREELARAASLDTNSVAVRLAAGRLYMVPGTFDRAAREYEHVVQLNPASPEGWLGLGRAYEEMQDRNGEAAEALRKAVEVQPGYYAPLIAFGDFYRLQGDYAEAERHWLRVVTLAPGRLDGHSNLGGLYQDMGRFADAERELQRALRIDPRSRPVLNNLGALYQYLGRDEDAIRTFEHARTVAPVTHILLLNLGDSYRRLGYDREAAAAYNGALDIADAILLQAPGDAATRAYVAYYTLRLGNRSAAERELTQALSSGVVSRAVLRRAAIFYEATGDRERTLRLLASAPPDVVRELSRQPDLSALRRDPRFARLLTDAKPHTR